MKHLIPLPQGVDPKTLTVSATLYSQSIPPYNMVDRLRIGGSGPNTKRLYYLTSNLN